MEMKPVRLDSRAVIDKAFLAATVQRTTGRACSVSLGHRGAPGQQPLRGPPGARQGERFLASRHPVSPYLGLHTECSWARVFEV